MRFPIQITARLATGLAACVAAAGGAAAVPGVALAHSAGRPSAGYVYLDDNTAGANTIAAFSRSRDGTLTALAGSPFAAGGAGTGQGIPSQGAIQLADHGRFLIAVDAASNQVSVLKVDREGAPTQVAGGPVGSGGVDPVSIAVHGDRVVVANADTTAPNLSSFRIRGDGRLVQISAATVALPPGSQPGDVLFNRSGTSLIATLVASSQIASFTARGNGLLTAAPGSPYAAQGLGPFGSEFSPTSPDQLFVSNAHNGTGLGTVSAFDEQHNGSLSPIGSSPFADNQTAPCWVTISPDGRYLYAVNTGSGTISSYTIARNGTLALDSSTTVSEQGGVGAVDPGLTPNGTVLYVNESRAGAVGEFAVHGSTLTELPGSPVTLPAGATPAGIAVQ